MRFIVRAILGAALIVGWTTAGGAQPAKVTGIPMKVFKSPTCGCCQHWVEHVKAAGFSPTVQDLASLDATKTDAGVPPVLRSCHTALVGGYVIEGHVPADVIHRLLREKPKVAGIAVPGMPIGSPGMEQGDRKDPYEIVSFTRDGQTAVYDKR
jgi:hypothetical protein